MSKHNPTKRIELLGKTYEVKFSLGTLSKIEEILGVNPFAQNFWQALSPRKILALVYSLIYKYEPTLTLDELGEKLDLSDIDELGTMITVLFSDAQPEKEKEQANPDLEAEKKN